VLRLIDSFGENLRIEDMMTSEWSPGKLEAIQPHREFFEMKFPPLLRRRD
jgi:hypothetical protein